MTPELHLAIGIVDQRVHAARESALLRTVELARREERRLKRERRRAAR